jgi:hypothetical protein
LNPYYSYGGSSNIFDDGIITEGFISCMETFYREDDSKQDRADNVEQRKSIIEKDPLPKKACENFLGLRLYCKFV